METYYSITNQVISGSLAAWAAVTTGQPFDLLKTRFQLNQDASFSWLKNHIQKNGVFSMYRGASSVYFFSGIITSFEFAIFEVIHKMGHKIPLLNLRKGSWQQYVLSGSLVGLSSSFIFTPVEYTKINTQMDTSSGKVQSSLSRIFSIIKKDGLRGVTRIYTGHSWTLIREIPGAGIYFGGFYILLDLLSKDGRDSSTILQHLMASGGSALVYVLYAYPFDVVKTNIQSNTSTFKKLLVSRFWKEKAFYDGFRIAVLKGLVIDMTLLPAYENVRRLVYNIESKTH